MNDYSTCFAREASLLQQLVPRWPSLCADSGLLESAPMMRIDGSYLYNLGARLHPLADVSVSGPLTVGDVRYPLFMAESMLTQLLQNRWFGLRTCLNQCAVFLAAVRDIQAKTVNLDTTTALDPLDVWRVKQQAQIFENVLAAELGTTDLYYVIPKGSHSTIELITDGRKSFPDDLDAKVPDAVFDAQEATRCLAFDRFTACGFHLHRANEAVLRKYWDAVTGGAARPKHETMGAFLGELKHRKKGKGSAKVRAALTEIKNLHRNPTIHPEHSLDQKQAMALMGVIHASIAYMLEEIPAPPAPSAVPSSLTAGGTVTP